MRELRERAEPALRILCYVLAAVLVYQLAGMILRLSPFHGVTVPQLPSLSTATNSAPGGARGTNGTIASTGKPTNSVARPAATNTTAIAAGTNTASVSTNISGAGSPGTNASATVASSLSATNATTNSLAAMVVTNTVTTNLTNVASLKSVATNGTNVASSMISTNSGTNRVALGVGASSNAAPVPKPPQNPPGSPFPGPGGPGKGSGLSPALQARVTKIYESEILGPVMRPLPMALLGIAGEVAFLRTDSGQTGLVKIGDSLGDLKLLRIGINRVLVEQNGQKKELTIFSGYGSESLMQNDSTNENTHP